MRPLDTPPFRLAVRDLRWLLERGYPRKAAQALVGDRHRLAREQRSALLRGIAPRRESRARRRKLTRRVRRRVVHVDCFNVLYTVQSYLAGRAVFVASDGFLRDAAEDHGKSDAAGHRGRALEILVAWARAAGVGELRCYLDAPVSHSARVAGELREAIARSGLRGGAELVKSPDRELKGVRGGLVATSDSAIIDAAAVRVVDVARLALERAFRPRFPRLHRLPRRAARAGARALTRAGPAGDTDHPPAT